MKRTPKTITDYEANLPVRVKNFGLRLDGAMRMPLNDSAVANARRFCLCEMARRVELPFQVQLSTAAERDALVLDFRLGV
jgi:hypothetical protein